MGVLSIREQLSNDLNDLGCPLAFTAVKYATDNYDINTVTEGIFWNVYQIMTSTSIVLRNKTKVYGKERIYVEKPTTATAHELNNSLYDLYELFGLKRVIRKLKQLDLVAADYFDFEDFYQKTQRAGYTKDK